MAFHHSQSLHDQGPPYLARPGPPPGWYRSGRTSKAFVWPKDGKNGTPWGRFKDVISNKGPDIYLTMNADKRDYMNNRPPRSVWSGWTKLDPWPPVVLPLNSAKYAPWTKCGALGGRTSGKRYDFRKRQYGNGRLKDGSDDYLGTPDPRIWTDARWLPEQYQNKKNRYPVTWRDIYGEWWNSADYYPQPALNNGAFVHSNWHSNHISSTQWI